MEALDIVKNIGPGFCSRLVLTTIDTLSLQQPEEALDGGVVRGAANSTHTADKIMPLEETLILVARKLTAAIRVQDDRRRFFTLP